MGMNIVKKTLYNVNIRKT